MAYNVKMRFKNPFEVQEIITTNFESSGKEVYQRSLSQSQKPYLKKRICIVKYKMLYQRVIVFK